MASIEVFPLSVNGIAPPLNLLTKTFTNTLNPSNLFYPLDLAANPNYGHAVQLTVFDTKYNVNNIVGGAINGSESINLNTISQVFNPSNLKLSIVNQTKATISLYMPDSLQMQYSHDWTQVSLTEMFGRGASFAGAALADWMKVKEAGSAGDKTAFANLYGKGMATEVAGGLLGGDAGSLIGNILGTVPNPQLQMLYKGTELREFQFQFKFTPASKKEAIEVEKIIETLQYYSAPQLLGTAAHQYLAPPQLFKINFLFVGGTGIRSEEHTSELQSH